MEKRLPIALFLSFLVLMTWNWSSKYNLLTADKRSWDQIGINGRAVAGWLELTIVPNLWLEVDRRDYGGLRK